QPFQVARKAFRLARLTDSAPVPDQLVGEQYPFFLRNNLDQVLLDLLWVGILRQIQAPAEPLHVRIDDDSGSNSKRRAEHDICRFSRNSRQGEKLRLRPWHHVAKFLIYLSASSTA